MMRLELVRGYLRQLASENIYVARAQAREDPTVDVSEDDYRPDPDAAGEDRAAGDHDR